MTTTNARARDLRFVSIEPGRIQLHGIALTDGEYAVLRGIAERMKQVLLRNSGDCVHSQDPRGCYRVRCQLGKQCVDDDLSPRKGGLTC
jgi:hypothetical protein